MKHKAVLTVGILLFLIVFSAFAGAVNDGNTHFLSMTTSRMSPMDTFEKLNAGADYIFKGTCIESEPVFQNNTLYTLSKVEIQAVFKGDLEAGDTAFLLETGGRTTAGRYREECHVKIKEGYADGDIIVVDLDGLYPLQKGETALLFAVDSSGFLEDVEEPVYSVAGDYEGKFFLQEDGAYRRPLSDDEKLIGFEGIAITEDMLRQAEE